MQELSKYVFPEGIVAIPKEEMQEALCGYDVVEIPGTVREVVIAADATKQVRTKEIVLNDGVVSVKNTGSHRLRVNITDTLMEVEGFEMPRVSRLPLSFRKAYHVSGIEYLQAYPQADVRYPWDDRLKHFVLLGDELPYIVHRFEHVPDGCVIHVETVAMAETVLKYVDADSIYVIPDAAEWKDFPVDRLEQEYDPEPLLTARQIEIRRENQAKRDAEEAKRQEVIRQEAKERSIRKMVEPVIVPLLEGLLGAQETVVDWRYQETISKYDIEVAEGETPGETVIKVKATVASGLEIDYNSRYNSKELNGYAVVLSFAATDFPGKLGAMAGQLTLLRDFLEAHRETINKYHLIPLGQWGQAPVTLRFARGSLGQWGQVPMTLRSARGSQVPVPIDPEVMVPFMENGMVGNVGMETIGEDATRIKEFVVGLEKMIRGAREVFPVGFDVVAVGK